MVVFLKKSIFEENISIMTRKTLFSAVTIAVFSFMNAQYKYPQTEKINHIDEYFGIKVNDPYRWLEDDTSENTKNWVKREVAFTNDYLAKIPYIGELRKQLNDIWNYEKIGTPFKEGDYTYFYKNDGLQAQSVLYRTGKDGKTEAFLDPNTFAKDGTTSLAGVYFNKKGNLVAYTISEGGSDWNKIIILDVKTKKQIDETLVDVKFSGVAWLGDGGFYYSSYDKPDGSVLSAKTDDHKIYFHKLGTKQSEDQQIIIKKDEKWRYLTASVTDDERFLVVSGATATNGNELYIKDLHKSNAEFVTIQKGFDFNTEVVDSQGDNIFVLTDKNAPNKKLQKFDFKNPSVWTDVIPETENVLSVSIGGGYFFAKYMRDAVSFVKQYGYNGQFIRDISLSDKGTASGFTGKKGDKEIFYSFTNYIIPSTTFKFDVSTGKSSVYQKSKIKFNPKNYVSEQVFYTSKDGTKVSMIISYKKGLKRNGKNPTILYGYGGFNASLTPGFSIANAIWMENGGVYAVPNIRGGGEYGKKWYDAGTKMQKKNVFEDFISAGEYLQKEGYTSKNFLALSGGSNGGLLVGAVMTMRPDLAKVAFPAVGVLDMLRYHKFTAGAGWAYDYGTSDDSKEMFEYLKSYSPLHNVKEGVCYPATLVTTGDHDDRVVPAHSFKFAAELQAKQKCSNPTLIRIAVNAGHGAGRSTEQIVNETADKFGFALYQMGIKKLPTTKVKKK